MNVFYLVHKLVDVIIIIIIIIIIINVPGVQIFRCKKGTILWAVTVELRYF
jgi:hypothetical protein